MKGFGWRFTGFGLVTLIIALTFPTHTPVSKIQVDGAVVTVTALNDQQEITARGNGFYIDRALSGGVSGQLLVTSRHLFMGANHAEIRTSDGACYAVNTIAAEDVDGDLVLCRTDLPPGKCPSLPIATAIPDSGMAITLAAPQQRESDGRLVAVHNIEGFGTLYQITRSISPDVVGSPVINDRKQVVGIAALSLSDRRDGHIVIPAARLITMVLGLGTPVTEWLSHLAPDWESSTDYLLFRGRALLALGEAKGARSCFEQVAKIDPKSTAAQSGLALCDGGHVSTDQSHKAMNGMKPPSYDASDLSIAAGEAFNQSGHFEEALKVLQEALKTKPDSSRIYIDIGIAYSNLHRDIEALEAFQHAAKLDPKEPAARLDMGLCYQILKQPTEAEAAFKEAIRLKPDYADAYAGLGLLYMDLQRNAQAIDALKQAIKYDAKDHVSAINLGLVYLRTERFTDAMTVLRAEARRYPEDARTHYFLGMASDKIGHSELAFKEFKEAIRLDPKSAIAYKGLGFLCERLQRYAESQAAFREATRLDPDDAEAQAKYGALCLNVKQYEEAVTALKSAIKMNPKSVAAQGNLGLAYLNLKRYDDAVETFQTVVQLDPRQPLAYYSLGRAHGYLRQYSEAATALKEAVRLDPKNIGAHYDLGMTYINLKDRTAAWLEYSILKLLDKSVAADLLKQIDRFLPEK